MAISHPWWMWLLLLLLPLVPLPLLLRHCPITVLLLLPGRRAAIGISPLHFCTRPVTPAPPLFILPELGAPVCFLSVPSAPGGRNGAAAAAAVPVGYIAGGDSVPLGRRCVNGGEVLRGEGRGTISWEETKVFYNQLYKEIYSTASCEVDIFTTSFAS